MKIGINGTFLQKTGTGIGQVTVHFLRTLIAMQKQIPLPDRDEYIIYGDREYDALAQLAFPENFSFHLCTSLYTRDDLIHKMLWERFTLPHAINDDGCSAFLSLYQDTTILRHTDVQHIMVVHDIIPKLFPEYMENWRKKLYQKRIEKALQSVDHIVTVSHHTKRDLCAHLAYDAKKITVAYISVDPSMAEVVTSMVVDRVMAQYHLTAGYIYVGGGLEIRKNVEQTVRAYASVRKNCENVPPLVVSGFFAPSLVPMVTDVEQLACDLDIKEHVHVLGFVAGESLPALYKNALFFVFSSRYEGFGMPILEAMSQGTPVLTADNSSLREVGGDAVLYCDSESVDDIAQKMQQLLVDTSLRERLRIAGETRATIFSWEHFTQTIIDTIKR